MVIFAQISKRLKRAGIIFIYEIMWANLAALGMAQFLATNQ